MLLFLLNSFSIPLNDPDNEFSLILPDEIPTISSNSSTASQNIKHINESSLDDTILPQLALIEKSHHFKNKTVRIGKNDYLILNQLGDGAEGITYTAKGPNDTVVVIKAMLDFDGVKEAFDMELYVLKRLNRLLEYDENHRIIVEIKLPGVSMDVELDKYAEEHVGENEFASDHQPLHLKEKYYKVLWDFRNATKIKHGDFRPYNVFGDQAIDFGRSELLSRNLRERKRQIYKDDKHAEGEWIWYYCYSDWDKLEKNPLIPNAITRANEIWDLYVDRYDDVEKAKKYRKKWMDVLLKIHETKNTSLKFPSSSDF